MKNNTYTHYYAFAAKGIQNYILQGNQVKLMIGGSTLIEQLPKYFLRELLNNLQLAQEMDYSILSSNAGGARILFASKDCVENLVKVLPLAISLYAPGLGFVQAYQSLGENLAATMDAVEKALAVRRNILSPVLPVPGPLVLRAPRSGLPAVGEYGYIAVDTDLIDVSAKARYETADQDSQSLLQKILPDENRGMATNVSDIAKEHEYLAVFHADANSLGKLVMSLLSQQANATSLADSSKTYKSFSASVEKATTLALKKALQPLMESMVDHKENILPFRILVCAGDDVTLLLKAKDAITFAGDYLQAFEEESGRQFQQAGIASDGLSKLTACAGLVFCHHKFPFAQAYELCESLCKYAKEKTSREASALAFYRITTGTSGDYKNILNEELSTTEGIELTQMPYLTGDNSIKGLPLMADLLALRESMQHLPKSALRSLIDEIYISSTSAENALDRMQSVINEREKGKKSISDIFASFEEALRKLTNTKLPQSALWQYDEGKKLRTPLYDALEIMSIER